MDSGTKIELALLVMLTIFAIHLMAHAMGVYVALGWVS